MDMTEEEIIRRMQALQSLGILPPDKGTTPRQPVTNLGMSTSQEAEPYKTMRLPPGLASPNIEDRRGEPPQLMLGAANNDFGAANYDLLRPVSKSSENMRAAAQAASGVTPKDPLSLDEPFVTNQFPASGKDEWHYKETENAMERQSTKTPVSLEEIMKRLSEFNFGVE